MIGKDVEAAHSGQMRLFVPCKGDKLGTLHPVVQC